MALLKNIQTDTGTGTKTTTTAPKTTTTAPAPVVAPAPIVKPKAAETQGTTDTATGGTVSPQTVVVAPEVQQALPVTTEVNALVEKPKAVAQQGYTDTGTGGDIPPEQQSVVQPAPAQTTVTPTTTAPAATTPTATPAPTPTVTPAKPSETIAPAETGEFTGKPVSVEKITPQENTALQNLQDMKFEYDPYADEEFKRQSEMYESQIAQMMTGRGGLYSSVMQQALQASIMSLQIDFRKQKYEEFLQERNFMFQMAQFIADENARAWTQGMQEKQFQLDLDQFAFAKDKEAFDQKMALANYQLNAQAQAFSQKMRQLEYEQALANQQYANLIQQANVDLTSAQNTVVKNAEQYQKDLKLYNYYLDKWKSSGTADTSVAKYFGVTTGTSISASYGMNQIVSKASELDQYKAYVYGAAQIVGVNNSTLQQVEEWFANRVQKTQTPTGPTLQFTK